MIVYRGNVYFNTFDELMEHIGGDDPTLYVDMNFLRGQAKEMGITQPPCSDEQFIDFVNEFFIAITYKTYGDKPMLRYDSSVGRSFADIGKPPGMTDFKHKYHEFGYNKTSPNLVEKERLYEAGKINIIAYHEKPQIYTWLKNQGNQEE